jgi:K+-transporting ATPase c subunit
VLIARQTANLGKFIMYKQQNSSPVGFGKRNGSQKQSPAIATVWQEIVYFHGCRLLAEGDLSATSYASSTPETGSGENAPPFFRFYYSFERQHIRCRS